MSSRSTSRTRLVALITGCVFLFGAGGLVTASFLTATPAPATVSATSASPPAVLPPSPFRLHTAFPWNTPVRSLTNHPATLARGSRATVVMAMASWCLYCGYEDKWVLPVLAKTPGVVIDVVDVSPHGGIANPGPQSPPFSGHDGTGGPLTTSGMAHTMQQYVHTFGTLNAPNVHVYVAPSTTRRIWAIQQFPTLAFIGSSGQVTVLPAGAQTLPQAQADLTQTLSTPH